MLSLPHFLQSQHFLALFVAILIFLITIFLVVKRYIGLSVAILLLLLSLAAGLVINQQEMYQNYFATTSTNVSSDENAFHKQVLQAVEDIRNEVNSEKENIRSVMNQIQDLFDTVESQKQKLQNFIDETKERFKAEYPSKSTPPQNP